MTKLNCLLVRAAALTLMILTALTCSGCARADRASWGDALFCWDWDLAQDWQNSGIFEDMEATGLTVLHQYVPEDADRCALEAFLTAAGERDVGVYLLTGEPEWGLDDSGEDICAEVARAVEYNAQLPKRARFQGVLVDVEPYLTNEWNEDAEDVMQTYAQAMKSAHAAAMDEGISLVACIPYFYDSMGHEEALAEVIREGCDGIAIMNYRKKDEARQIETEMRLAAGKPVSVIYELQRPGKHGLTKRNTYYEEGLPGVRESVAALKERYGAHALSFALHDYSALKELLED